MHDKLRPMARKRARRSFCPSCDEPLDEGLAAEADPKCPACDEPLQPVKAAPLHRRIAAAAIDAAILLPTAGLLNWLLLVVVDAEPLLGDAEGVDALLRTMELDPFVVLRRVVPFLVMMGLYVGLFWALKGRTVGGRVLGLRVIDWRGHTPHPAIVALRVVAHVGGLLVFGLGWIWTAFDVEKRAWHDHISRTYVVRDP
jgi:uncharacterized RDD family membrane protein YckC